MFLYGAGSDAVVCFLLFRRAVFFTHAMPDIRSQMADSVRGGSLERDIEQAIIALKKGACLLKYGRRGKPKFCPFRLSNDESTLIWYSGKVEKQLILSHVSKIIPGQRTPIFQRYPRPDKEYQSFSLITKDRSLDLICKDKDEAEVWFVGLRALISCGNYKKKSESKGERISDPNTLARRNLPLISPFYDTDTFQKDAGDAPRTYENPPVNSFAKVFSDVILYTAASKSSIPSESVRNSVSSLSSGGVDNSTGRGSAVETFRVSLSSAISTSSNGSCHGDFDALGDVFIWGEGIGDGVLGGGLHRIGSSYATKTDAPLPKALESAVMLDVHNIACGSRHAVLVTKQGELFSWGEESGGRLGHGVDANVSHPKLVDALGGMNVELVACGEFHTCAVTLSGDLYTWGDGIHNCGLLGHGSEASHWIPKLVAGQLEGLLVSSVSCGPWHTAVVTSAGQLFTFGDGIFGALGHGDRKSTNMPREVEALKGLRTVRAACGVWHTAAVVEITVESTNNGNPASGKLFTWGEGEKGQLGHGDGESRLVPACVVSLSEPSFCQVACGNDITIALTTSGQVYTMGSIVHGQLGNPVADGKLPTCIEGELSNYFVEEISCGSYHAAVLTSRTEVYTWGKGANGQLGHGDKDDRTTPTLVEALKDKQVKSVACGANFTAVICLHKWVSSADQSVCSGCCLQFGFRRKRHNCYNCGLFFCKACSSRRSAKASLAPNVNKPYRVCDECYVKLKKITGSGIISRIPKHQHGNQRQISNEFTERESVCSSLHGQGPRISSVGSFKGESRHSKLKKSEPNNSRLPPLLNETSKLGSSYPFKSSNIFSGSPKKKVSASVPSSRTTSRSTSPVSSMQSPLPSITIPPVSCLSSLEVVADESKKMNDNAMQVVRLQLQVQDLTRKAGLLEAELKRTSKLLREATAKAEEEAAKYHAANEVIKSLTAQAPKSNGQLGDPLPNNTIVPEETEWVEQVEPGVYLSVYSSPGGERHLKRVRFSRKKFSEQQAETWWSENKVRLQKQYIIPTAEKSNIDPASTSDSNESMID